MARDSEKRFFKRFFGQKIEFLFSQLEKISFFRAVCVGLALGIFGFGVMLFAAIAWLVR